MLLVLVRGVLRLELSWGRLLAATLLCSGATLPYVWFVFTALPVARLPFLIIVESFAALTETGILRLTLGVSWRRALLLSCACNGFSFAMGLLIFP